jgi:hypothetical protein
VEWVAFAEVEAAAAAIAQRLLGFHQPYFIEADSSD